MNKPTAYEWQTAWDDLYYVISNGANEALDTDGCNYVVSVLGIFDPRDHSKPATPEPPVAPDVRDKQDGQKDFYDRYYVHIYYCGNCDAGNTRYVRKGVKVTSVPVTCEKCGCEIQARRQTLLWQSQEVDELAKFYGGLREEKGVNDD